MFDHELKLGRARKHLQDLNGVVGPWIEQKHYRVRYEYEPDRAWAGPIPPAKHELPRGGSRMYLGGAVTLPGLPPFDATDAVFGQGVLTAYVTAEQPPTDPISLLIGDAMHNLRSALDVLAFSLAAAHTKPLPKEIADRSEFPIFGNENGDGRDLFHRVNKKTGRPAFGSGLIKIDGWHPGAQAAVERLQPYKRGNEFRSDPLWLLHELDRISKHRLLHVGIAASAGTGWKLEPPVEALNIRAIGPASSTPSADRWIPTHQ